MNASPSEPKSKGLAQLFSRWRALRTLPALILGAAILLLGASACTQSSSPTEKLDQSDEVAAPKDPAPVQPIDYSAALIGMWRRDGGPDGQYFEIYSQFDELFFCYRRSSREFDVLLGPYPVRVDKIRIAVETEYGTIPVTYRFEGEAGEKLRLGTIEAVGPGEWAVQSFNFSYLQREIRTGNHDEIRSRLAAREASPGQIKLLADPNLQDTGPASYVWDYSHLPVEVKREFKVVSRAENGEAERIHLTMELAENFHGESSFVAGGLQHRFTIDSANDADYVFYYGGERVDGYFDNPKTLGEGISHPKVFGQGAKKFAVDTYVRTEEAKVRKILARPK